MNDAGENGKWSVLEGRVDANSGSVDVVSDGRIPTNADQPKQNFFFAAYASGSTISMNAEWFRGQLNGEARGAVVHEMVHIVQGYPGRGRRVRNVVAPPGWIVEGIPDYIRWFLYEPHTKGAQLSPQALAGALHDASYRTSANFIDWVIRQHPLDGKWIRILGLHGVAFLRSSCLDCQVTDLSQDGDVTRRPVAVWRK